MGKICLFVCPLFLRLSSSSSSFLLFCRRRLTTKPHHRRFKVSNFKLLYLLKMKHECLPLEAEEKRYLRQFTGLRRRALARRKIRELKECDDLSSVKIDPKLKRYVQALLDSRDRPSEITRFEILLFVFILAIYVKTMYPTISGGDSGELVVSACNLGAAHPPGCT